MEYSEIERLYDNIKEDWEIYLKKDGVKLPLLGEGRRYTKNALILIYLYKNINCSVSKKELTNFLERMRNANK